MTFPGSPGNCLYSTISERAGQCSKKRGPTSIESPAPVAVDYTGVTSAAKLAALDIAANKNNRVIAAQYASKMSPASSAFSSDDVSVPQPMQNSQENFLPNMTAIHPPVSLCQMTLLAKVRGDYLATKDRKNRKTIIHDKL